MRFSTKCATPSLKSSEPNRLEIRLENLSFVDEDGARDEDAAHGSLSLEASRNVHSIAIEIVSLYDQIPQMDSDAEHHAVEFALVPVRVRDRLPLVCAAGVPKGLPFAYRAGQSPIQSNRKSSSLAAQRGVSAFNFKSGSSSTTRTSEFTRVLPT